MIDMSCICQICGNRYKVDINIPDELWEKIRNKKNLLCGKCIIERVELINEYNAYQLVKL